MSSFVVNELVVDATVRCLTVVGEACKYVPQEVRDLSPEVPWRQIAGMRDRVVHDYVGVDLQAVWTAVSDDIPPLLVQLRALLARLP